MNTRRFLPVIVISIIAIIILFGVSNSLFYTISATQRAVIFRKFTNGLDKDHIMGPGFHTKAPWNEVYVYNVQETSKDENMDVLDKNGLSIHVDVTVRFNPIPNKIGYIYEKFNVNYVDVLVVPEVRSAVRQVMGRF